MAIVLYDQEEVLRSFVESERYEAAEKAENAAKIEMAREMIHGNEPIDKIVRYSGLPRETILELQSEQLQPV